MRLIDADALKDMHGMKDDCADCDKELRGKSRSCEFDRVYTLMDFCGWLDDAPTIEPDHEKPARWVVYETANCDGEPPIAWECPECGEVVSCKYKFCPECGKPMEA